MRKSGIENYDSFQASVVAAVSAAAVYAKCRRHACRYSQNPRRRITIGWTRKAEREREGSAAGSIQRTKKSRVGRYRVTAEQQLATNTQQTRPPERESLHRRISHRCVPNPLSSRERQRAGPCSTAPARIVPFALQAWNETGIRFLPCRFRLKPLRTRNGS